MKKRKKGILYPEKDYKNRPVIKFENSDNLHIITT